jgi:putative ABC transport system permease protein
LGVMTVNAMFSALSKKSATDMKRRKARTFFTILTIAIGVSSLGLFSVLPLVEQSVEREVWSSNMDDVVLHMNDTRLNDAQLENLRGIDNIRDLDAEAVFHTRIFIGDRRDNAIVIGVRDFSDQRVDKITKVSGSWPGPMEVLTDSANVKTGLLKASEGDRVRMYDASGNVMELNITGQGHNIKLSGAPFGGTAVFYATVQTVRALANMSGFNAMALDLHDYDKAPAYRTVSDVRAQLERSGGFGGFTQAPEIRQQGDWPLKYIFEGLSEIFNLFAYMILFCSLFLIANTMHTIITEQKKEVAQMKAIGATRSQIVRSYLTTSFIMGSTGAVAGAALGIFMAYGMVSVFGGFLGLEIGLSVYLPNVALSIVVGIAMAIGASVPALLLALKVTVREGMEGAGITADFGASPFDRWSMKAGYLPMSTRMGIRNALRKKGRSVSTALQVSLAVGLLLGTMAFTNSMYVEVDREWANIKYDITTTGLTEGGRPLTGDVRSQIEAIDGVKSAEPYLLPIVDLYGKMVPALALEYNTAAVDTVGMMSQGRWFTQQEQQANATITVIAKNLAADNHLGIGDRMPVRTGAGLTNFTVVGITYVQMYLQVYFPLGTMQNILGQNGTVQGFFVLTTGKGHSDIDRTSTRIDDALAAGGLIVNSKPWYIEAAIDLKGPEASLAMITAISSLIVLVTMVGLMSTLTMNVIERTKEIGMMRCLGSSSMSLVSVFGSEGILLSLIGWVVGIPVGYVFTMLINQVILDSMHVIIPVLFPAGSIAMSLLIMLGITVLVMQPPLWRAARFKPGEALRYQ